MTRFGAILLCLTLAAGCAWSPQTGEDQFGRDATYEDWEDAYGREHAYDRSGYESRHGKHHRWRDRGDRKWRDREDRKWRAREDHKWRDREDRKWRDRGDRTS